MLRILWGLELIQQHNPHQLHMSTGSRCWMRWIWYRYIPSVCIVCQILTVAVCTSGLNSRANYESEMSPICNGCWVWSSWSVVAHFTHSVVNNISRSHLWDRDNPHGTVESNYQHSFSVNVWCGVVWCHRWPTRWSVHFPASDRWCLCQLFARWTASILRVCSSTNTMTDVLPAW